MCRDILNSCVRNTEEAEKSSRGANGANAGTSGRGQARGVWGMIEESELAKTIRQGEEYKVQEFFISRFLVVHPNFTLVPARKRYRYTGACYCTAIEGLDLCSETAVCLAVVTIRSHYW
jgi:hypothetical protein